MSQTEGSRPSRGLKWTYVRLVLLLVDLIALLLALRAAYVARYVLGWSFAGDGSALQPLVPPLCLAVTLTTFWVLDLYSMRLVGSGLDEYRAVVKDTTFAFAAIVVTSYIDQNLRVSRMFLLLFWLAAIVCVATGRFLARRLVRRWSRLRGGLRRLIVVGANNQAVELARELTSNRAACSTVLGFLSDYRPVGQQVDHGLRILGEPMQLYEIGQRLEATHAVVVQSALTWESLRFMVRSMHRNKSLELLLAPGLFDMSATPMQFTQVGSASLMVPSATRIVGFEALFKRTFDIVVSVPALIATLPIQAGIWVYLRTSGILRPFQLIRATGLAGHSITMPRFVGGERLLSSHLSRLPSLWLVIRGDMSIVGPRPVIEGERSGYEGWSDVLGSLKPGFIGPWWVSGRGRPAGLEDEIEADLHYARSYSIWLDIRIVVGVVWTLVTNLFRKAGHSAPEANLPAKLARATDED